MDKLNIQAHKNALASSDEFVMDAFVTEDKVSSEPPYLTAVILLTDENTNL
jgi:hypothetical protein